MNDASVATVLDKIAITTTNDQSKVIDSNDLAKSEELLPKPYNHDPRHPEYEQKDLIWEPNA
jgi:hypothetical protein